MASYLEKHQKTMTKLLKLLKKLIFEGAFLILLVIGLGISGGGVTHAATIKTSKNSRKAPKKQDTNAFENAISEIQKIKEIKNKRGSPPINRDASMGIFALNEPQLKIIERTWKYVAGTKFQIIKPQGKVHSSFVGDFDLDKYDKQVLPSLELGIAKDYENQPFLHLMNGYIQIGYNSYVVPVVFSSGYKAQGTTRFKTTLFNAGIEGQSEFHEKSLLSYKLGLAMGKFFYTQTSLNDFAQFSEGLLFGSWNTGLNYQWFENFSIRGDYIYRTPLQKSSIGLQSHNLELGLRVQW